MSDSRHSRAQPLAAAGRHIIARRSSGARLQRKSGARGLGHRPEPAPELVGSQESSGDRRAPSGYY